MKKLWMRAGVTLSVTKAEADDIISSCGNAGGDEACRREILTQVIKEGRFAFDGESYVPAVCVNEFNRENDTNYDEYDYEADLDIPAKEICGCSEEKPAGVYVVIEKWADATNDEVGENVCLFSGYDSALAQYKAALAAEREGGLLARWGEKSIMEEGDDYICATDPTKNDYVGHHYKLYVELKTVMSA